MAKNTKKELGVDPTENRDNIKSFTNASRYITQLTQFGMNLLAYTSGLISKASTIAKDVASTLQSIPGVGVAIGMAIYGMRAYSGKERHRNRRLIMMGVGAVALGLTIAVPPAAAIAGMLYAAATVVEAAYRSNRLYKRWQSAKDLAAWAEGELEKLNENQISQDPRKIPNKEMMADLNKTINSSNQKTQSKTNASKKSLKTLSSARKILDYLKTNPSKNVKHYSSLSVPLPKQEETIIDTYLDQNITTKSGREVSIKNLVNEAHFEGSSLEETLTHKTYCKHKFTSKAISVGIMLSVGIGVAITMAAPYVGLPLIMLASLAFVANNFIYKSWNEDHHRTGFECYLNQDTNVVKQGIFSFGKSIANFFRSTKPNDPIIEMNELTTEIAHEQPSSSIIQGSAPPAINTAPQRIATVNDSKSNSTHAFWHNAKPSTSLLETAIRFSDQTTHTTEKNSDNTDLEVEADESSNAAQNRSSSF